MKRNKMVETKLIGKQSEDAKWRRKKIGNDERNNKRRMTQRSQIQLINTKGTGQAPNPSQKRYARMNDRPKTWCVKFTPMCASARVAPSNIVYQWYGYRSTGIDVLTTEICFSNIIWIYVLCERVLVSECKLNKLI